MRRQSIVWAWRVAAAAVFLPAGVVAQQWRVLDEAGWCDRWNGRTERHCEVRVITLLADRDVIAVDGRQNGGVRVRGWDRNEIELRAKVQAWAHEFDEAEELASEIEIQTGSGPIRARGPTTRRHHGWAVSYELMVPRRSNLSLETHNGGIHITDVHGEVRFEATNGGVHLDRLGGDVRGRTTNGGVDIELHGDSWDGSGLDVRTTNGGVDLVVPSGYSAELVTGTVNGGMRIDFPITVQGNIGRRLQTTLGRGGPSVRAVTTNGGVTLRRG